MALQASWGEGLFPDPRPLGQDGLASTEADIGRHEVAQALVGMGAIVVLDGWTCTGSVPVRWR